MASPLDVTVTNARLAWTPVFCDSGICTFIFICFCGFSILVRLYHILNVKRRWESGVYNVLTDKTRKTSWSNLPLRIVRHQFPAIFNEGYCTLNAEMRLKVRQLLLPHLMRR